MILWAKFPYKVGDLVLVSYPCYLCQMIERLDGSPFSHIGMISSIDPLMVLEAFGAQGVSEISLTSFLSRKLTQGSVVLTLRPKVFKEHIFNKLRLNYMGKPYDPAFRWDGEKLYCSELIYKLYSALQLTSFKLKPKKVYYTVDRKLWENYFSRYGVPDGELAISPGDFYRYSSFFNEVQRQINSLN
jgi:hypothetical protein